MLWRLLDYIRMPGTPNVYSLLMAQQYYVKHKQPFHSAVDKARERQLQEPTRVNAAGQKRRSSKR